MTQSIATSLARRAGRICRISGCKGNLRKDYVGHLCRKHERRQRVYGHPEAVPLTAGEVHLWRTRAKRVLQESPSQAPVIEALRVCNALLGPGAECFKEESLRRQLAALQLQPQTLLELTVGMGLRFWSKDPAPMPDAQPWHEALKWALRIGKAGESGRRLGTLARREFVAVLNKRLGLFVLRCAERWRLGKALEAQVEEALGARF